MTKRCLSVRLKEHATQINNSATHVKTHMLLQTCKQVVTSLLTSCCQDVFALLVLNLLEQVWNKLLTNCNKLDATIRPVTRLFQQD